MKLKSYKTIQMMFVVVSASALMTACHTKLTEPLKLMSRQGVIVNQTATSLNTAPIVESYGVPQAQNVLFGENAVATSLDFTY